MPYCTRCGSPVREQDRFCTRCGALLSNQSPPPPPKPVPDYFWGLSTKRDFAFGIQIGVCVATILIGLLVLLALNSIYWDQWRVLQLNGLSIQETRYIIHGIAFGMGLCAYGIIYAAYSLLYGLFIQLNPTMQALLSNGLNRARLGIALVNGGLIWLAFMAMQFCFEINSDPPNVVQPSFVLVGLIVIVVGVVMLVHSYRRSRKQATKV